MKLGRTLVDLLRDRSQSQGDQVALSYLKDGKQIESSLTYSRLDNKARAIAACLQSKVSPGERALLLFPPGLDYVAAFFACLYAGIIAVPVYPPHPARLQKTLPRLRAIAKDAQVKVLLTIESISMLKPIVMEQAPELVTLDWLTTDSLGDREAGSWQDPNVTENQIAFLQYTSGSTGNPKGVMLTHHNLLSNAAYIEHIEEDPGDRLGVFWLPMYHDMGLIGGIIQPLYYGQPSILMSPLDFLYRPMRWLEAISRYKATHSAAPNFAYELCVRKVKAEEKEKLDLSSWCIAYNGAEPINPDVIENFVSCFEECGFKKSSFYPVYGLAEATLLVTSGKGADLPKIISVDRDRLKDHQVKQVQKIAGKNKRLVSCGRTYQSTQVKIVDPSTCVECQEGEIGEIWVCGPAVAIGYWDHPKATKELFQAHLAKSKTPHYLRTGDLGFLLEGNLYVTGRLKDLIIIAGMNHYPSDIEKTIEEACGHIRRGCCAAFSAEMDGSEQLIIMAEISSPKELIETELAEEREKITKAVTEKHDLLVQKIVFLNKGELPKTSSGKIMRYACRELFQNNSHLGH